MKEVKHKKYLYEERDIIETEINIEQIINDVYSFMLDKEYFQIDEKQLEKKILFVQAKLKKD